MVLRHLPGVHQLEQEGRSVRLRIKGDADEVVQSIQARPYALRDLDIVPVRLDEVLLSYIRGDEA